jgi:SAM-dependent methyltransferase
MDAYDLAPGVIDEAKRLAAAEQIDHINYQVVDLEETELPVNYYDVVFACESVHHFSKLEWLFANVKASLRPGGLFILHEYVGPSQFQFEPRVVEMIDDILALLPAAMRERVSAPGTYKSELDVASVEEMNRRDPSEAIRSADILACLTEDFDIIEKKDLGGTLNRGLLQDIIHNFHSGPEERLALLELLLEHEDVLIQEKIIPSDFVSIVATPKVDGFVPLTTPPKVTAAHRTVPNSRNGKLLGENVNLKQQLQVQEAAMVELDRWAHDLERTVIEQQAQIERYERMLSVRVGRKLKLF